MKTKDKTLKIIAGIFFVIGVCVIIVFTIKLYLNYGFWKTEIDYESTTMVGTFIGGVASAFFTGGTIILVYLTYNLNRDEMNKINIANNKLVFLNASSLNFTNFRYLLETLHEIHEKNLNGNIYPKFERKFDEYLRERVNIKLDSNDELNFDLTILIDEIKNNKNTLLRFGKDIKLLIDCLKLILKLLDEESKNIYLYKIRLLFKNEFLVQALSRFLLCDVELLKINIEHNLIDLSEKKTIVSYSNGQIIYELSLLEIYEKYISMNDLNNQPT